MSDDPYRYFRVEARDLVDQLARGALELERGASAASTVPQLLRVAHTLKGAARVVRQREIADLAHAIEDALAPLRDDPSAAPPERIELLLAHVAGLGARLAGIAPADAPGATAPEEPVRVVRADVAQVDEIVRAVTSAQALLSSVRRVSASALRARKLAEALEAQMLARTGEGERPAERTRMRALAQDVRASTALLERGLAEGLGHLERELAQVRSAAERVRLVPASALLDVLERTARDAARTLGKRVTIETEGGALRLDAHVLALVQGALVQAVKNAVAHGIELEPARRAAGKSAEGRIRIEVVRRARRVVFSCADDGRGVDLEAIRRIAKKNGVLSSGSERLSSAEIVSLLLRGGISTSGSVTELAGRGIGLDVVRDACARLGGDVRVDTDEGRGTRIELSVPVLASALDVLLVEAQDRVYAIPASAVERAHRARTGEATPGAALATPEGALTFAPLVRCLDGTRAESASPRPRAWSVVIVRSAARAVAIGVDRIIEHRQLVVRPPPELAPLEPIVSGVALDEEGGPLLVLEPSELVARACGLGAAPGAAVAAAPLILVVDDSLTTRMLEQSILELAGFEVDLAASGEEALEKLALAQARHESGGCASAEREPGGAAPQKESKRRRYGCLLVDVEMPGIDGFELVARIRADPALHEVPAILVTSRASAEDRARGEAAGADGYIVKGEFDQRVLLDRIRALLERR